MRTTLSAAALAISLGVLTSHAQVGTQPGSGFTTVLSSAMRYTMNYEQRFAVLAADEALRAGDPCGRRTPATT